MTWVSKSVPRIRAAAWRAVPRPFTTDSATAPALSKACTIPTAAMPRAHPPSCTCDRRRNRGAWNRSFDSSTSVNSIGLSFAVRRQMSSRRTSSEYRASCRTATCSGVSPSVPAMLTSTPRAISCATMSVSLDAIAVHSTDLCSAVGLKSAFGVAPDAIRMVMAARTFRSVGEKAAGLIGPRCTGCSATDGSKAYASRRIEFPARVRWFGRAPSERKS
mmetsp:Transcript_2086/g.5159  ORF Transcript_2086/g.5159 Transcript_2086/m.5159 type:complete len:218 (+) Transcript_2086:638-1291(+)